MMKAGLVPEEAFKETGYLGSHYATELAIKNRMIDIVADNDKSHTKMLEEGRISRETNIVIWKSPPIPGPPLAVRGDLPDEVKQSLKDSITSVPPDVITGFGKVVKYKLVDDSDYEILRQVKSAIDRLR